MIGGATSNLNNFTDSEISFFDASILVYLTFKNLNKVEMKNLLKLEDLAAFLLAIVVFSHLEYSWWYFPALLILPDLSMVGYLKNSRIGAILYNVFHHKALGIIIGFAGFMLMSQIMMLIGIILFAHVAMDRVFGYGLKFSKSFKSTHLGQIG